MGTSKSENLLMVPSKSRNLLFDGLDRDSKKATQPHVRAGFTLGLHGLKPGFAWFQTQDKPAKSRFLLFAVSF
jgi:hypothetical protein